MRVEEKHRLAKLRHLRVRKKISGTAECPRMSVCFTNRNIHVQFIDDIARRTIAAVSTKDKSVPDRDKLAGNVASAALIGKLAAEAAKAKGITAVVFDRGAAQYQAAVVQQGKDGKPVTVGKDGKVAALARAAREAGLKF